MTHTCFNFNGGSLTKFSFPVIYQSTVESFWNFIYFYVVVLSAKFVRTDENSLLWVLAQFAVNIYCNRTRFYIQNFGSEKKWPRFRRRHFQMHILEWRCLNLTKNGPIDNIPALVQIMAWRRPGDKSLSEPMIVSLLSHTYVTGPHTDSNQYWPSREVTIPNLNAVSLKIWIWQTIHIPLTQITVSCLIHQQYRWDRYIVYEI